jgi:hypothetical protein
MALMREIVLRRMSSINAKFEVAKSMARAEGKLPDTLKGSEDRITNV